MGKEKKYGASQILVGGKVSLHVRRKELLLSNLTDGLRLRERGAGWLRGEREGLSSCRGGR